MKRPNLSHAARIARVEVRRSARAIRSSGTQTAAFAVALLFGVGLPTLGGGYVAYHLGQALPDVSLPFSVLDVVRGTTAVGWVGIAVLAATRAAGRKGELDAPEGMLTTVPARDAALGLLLAEYARMALVAAIPVVTVAAALAVGAGVLAPLATIPATAAVLLAVALTVGFPVGLAVKWVTFRTPWLARHRTALLVAAFGAYFVVITSDAFNEALAGLQRALRDTPLAWFGDAALLGVPGLGAVPAHALGAGVLAAALLPAFAALGVSAAETLWYADRATPEDESADEDARSAVDSAREDSAAGSARETSLAESALAAVAARQTRTVTLAAWRRMRRAPIKLLYVVYPLFFLYAPLRTAFESGVPTTLPVLIAVYGTWAVGATVLNPLGDEGAVLPTTLLTGISGRAFVAGHVLSAALVGGPLVVVATAVTGAVSPLPPTRWLALSAVSGVLVVAGAVLAVGIGSVFPRFGTVEVFRSREATVPSKSAFAVYSLALLAGAAGATVATVPAVAEFVAGLLGASASVPRVVGGGVTVAVAVVGPVVAYRHAVGAFETFTFE
jgi:hypothetical protein